MNKIYQRIDWENYPSSATPLNEDNLNKMDYAIDKLDDRVVAHETTKLDTATGNSLVKDVTFDETTGIFTIEKLSGSKITINTALEKISTNFHFNPTTQKLVLTLIDGTVQEIDLSALITQYEFLESDTIAFTVDSNGKVTASVKNGSITGDKLEPNYLADVTLQANNAKDSADNAKESELLAFQYAEDARQSASETQKNDATNITYSNATSGLTSDNVQGAIDDMKVLTDGKAAKEDGVPKTCKTITNWNDALTNGWYMGVGANNSPSSTAWWFGRVIAHNENYVIQEAWSFTSNTDASLIPKKIRAKKDGTWGAWVDDTPDSYVRKSSILSTMDECEASTNSTDIVGVSALIDLKDNLNNFYMSNINWEVILNTNSTTTQTYTIDVDKFAFFSLELCFGGNIISQIILPVENYSLFRNISGFVDTSSNIAIGYLYFTSSTQVSAKVTQQVNTNGIYVRLRGTRNNRN